MKNRINKKDIKKRIMIGIVLLIIVLVSANVFALNQCSDGIDNDLDGKIDYPADNGCDNAEDRTESLKLGYADGCLTKGETLEDVFGNINYACKSTHCLVCVIMTEAGNYTTLPSKCSGLPKCGFSGSGGSIELDVTPPEITVNSPNNNDIFNSRKVLFDISLNELSSLYYLDNINGRGRWKLMTSKGTEYNRELNFKDGLNDVTIKATDLNGNVAEVTREFYVDSKDPKIKKTYPKKGFASGLFEVEFDEMNPESLILHYSSYGNYLQKVLDINDCEIVKKKYYCDVNVDLSLFDGESIQYWFELKDIAENIAESKPIELIVDITKPVIVNPDDFWTQGEGRNAKYVYFDIEINEDNFDEVSYFYEDIRGKMKEKRLCSKLKEGRCVVRKSFRNGETLLNIQIVDEAGNVEVKDIGLEISY